jgi:hypothetical protein
MRHFPDACAIQELLIDPLPDGASHDGAFYPDGARFTDLKEVRDLLYKKQRPAITPNVRSSCFYIFFPPLIPVPSCLRLAFSMSENRRSHHNGPPVTTGIVMGSR